MTTIQVDFWNLVGLLLAFFGCIGLFGRLLLAQIDKRLDERFKTQEKARVEGATALRGTLERYAEQGQEAAREITRLERDFLKWQAEVPVQYVRREDYIRGQSTIEAKIDAVYSKLEVVQLKGVRNG